MPTKFDLFNLGTAPDFDSVEGNTISENHTALEGLVFGGASNPLAASLQTLSPDPTNGFGTGLTTAYDVDNNLYTEQFNVDGVTRTHDATMIFEDSVITYTDGSTALVDALVMQDTDGNLYLLPPTSGPSPYSNALELRPIESLELGTANPAGGTRAYGMTADRYDLDILDYTVDGTGGDDLIDGSYTADPEGDLVDAGDNLDGDNDDSVQAGDGNDTVYGGAGDDTVQGGDGDDLLDGGAGDDELSGDAGDDTLVGGAGADDLEGGAGQDVADYSGSSAGVDVDLSTGSYSGGDAQGDSGTGIDGLVGSDFDDTLTGYDGTFEGGTVTNVIDGGAGNDDISGLGGGDTLIGGAGSDTVDGGAGDDILYGDQPPQPGTWNYEVYDYDFGSSSGQAFDIESGTLAGSGQTDAFDSTALINDARGTAGNPSDFGAIYTSQIAPDQDGVYTFSTTSDDGSTIRILDENGNPLTWDNQGGGTASFMDNDYHQAATTRSGEVTLEAGRIYTIEVRHWENAGAEVISGSVTPPGGTAEDLVDSPLIIGPEPAGDDDTLDGGDGADEIFGQAGDDQITVDQGDTARGGDGDDTFTLQDQDATGTQDISIIGGEGDETDGDTLILTPDVTPDDITFTNTDDSNGGLSGSFTMADGTFVEFSEIENIICFTPGTNILTQHGERAIETLRIGDMVVTRDHGLRPIRWIGRRTVPGHGNFAPVHIGAGIMDGARCGLSVSPQHRVLFTGYRAELLFGEPEVLIPAKHLINGHDVVQREQPDVTYIHIMFDCHEVIYAEGIATESFHAGDVGLSAICEAAREELFAIFPELRSAPGHHLETARPCLKRHEARLLLHQPMHDESGQLSLH